MKPSETSWNPDNNAPTQTPPTRGVLGRQAQLDEVRRIQVTVRNRKERGVTAVPFPKLHTQVGRPGRPDRPHRKREISVITRAAHWKAA